MDFNEKMEHMSKLSQKIKAKEPPMFTVSHKQAAITMAEVEKVIVNLIMEKTSLKVIFASLFYFWLTLEAPLRNISEQKIDRWSMPLDEAILKIISVIQSTVNSLPDHEPTLEMKQLGENVNALKASIPDEQIDPLLLPDELVKQATNVNTRIHTITSNFLSQSFHPEIISNVLFGYWMRISTLHAYVSEEYYQKMEFYFSEIIDAARKQVPILFQ